MNYREDSKEISSGIFYNMFEDDFYLILEQDSSLNLNPVVRTYTLFGTVSDSCN